MKLPQIFLLEKKLDEKVEHLLKEKLPKGLQVEKDEIPTYAIQENGDYLVMLTGIIINMPESKSMTNSTFYFTVDGEEHKLYRGNNESNWLDEKPIALSGSLVSKLLDLGLIASLEPHNSEIACNDWTLEMKHATERAYKDLVKLVNKT